MPIHTGEMERGQQGIPPGMGGSGMSADQKMPSVDIPEDMWRHRSAQMKCRTCMYFVKKESCRIPMTPEFEVGRCRRHAPTMSGWPVMRGGDWCGDHKLDENKV